MNIWVTFSEIDGAKRAIDGAKDQMYSSISNVQDAINKLVEKFNSDILKVRDSFQMVHYDLSLISYVRGCNERKLKDLDNEKSNTSTGNNARIEYLDKCRAPYIEANRKLDELHDKLIRRANKYQQIERQLDEQISTLNHASKQYQITVDSIISSLENLIRRLDDVEKTLRQILEELDPYAEGVHITDSNQFVTTANDIKEQASRLASFRKDLAKANVDLQSNLQDDVVMYATKVVDDMNSNNSAIKVLDKISESLYRVEQLIRYYNSKGV